MFENTEKTVSITAHHGNAWVPPAHLRQPFGGGGAEEGGVDSKGNTCRAKCSICRGLFSFAIHQLGWGTALKACWSALGLWRWLFFLQVFCFSSGALPVLLQSGSAQELEIKGNFVLFCLFFPLQMEFWNTYIGKSCFLHVQMHNINVSVLQ